jgi:5-oxoprolinase (ATP-hydrolysing)
MRDITRQQWLILATAMAGWTLDSLDFVVYLMAIPSLQGHFGFGAELSGLLATITLVTSAVGGIGLGYLSDRWGRARTMLLSIALFSFCSLGTATAQTLPQLMMWRALLGIGLGGEWATGATLVSESWPAAHRGKAIGLMQSGWALGYILAAVLAGLLLPTLGWRWLFALSALPAILLLWMRRQIEEPAIWLTSKASPQSTRINTFKVLWEPQFRRITALSIALLAAVMFGYWGVFTWLPNFLASPLEKGGAGLGLVKSVGWIVPMQLGAFAGYISFGWISDHIGRKPSLIAFLLVTSIIVPIYGAMARSPWMLMVLGPVLGFVGHGYFSVFGALIAEVFPTHVRATAQGVCYNMGKIFGAGAPLVIGAAAAAIGVGPALAITSAFFLLGALLAWRLPETRGAALLQGVDETLWAFWIDVGGTFTDCICRRPDGTLSSHKLLSSGAYRGQVAVGSNCRQIKFVSSSPFVADFFTGYTLRLEVAHNGKSLDAPLIECLIVGYDPVGGYLTLDRDLVEVPPLSTFFTLISGEPAPVTGIRYLMGLRLKDAVPEVEVRLGTTIGTNALLERRGTATAFVTTAGFGDVLDIAYQARPKLFDLVIRKPRPLFEAVLEVSERVTSKGEVLLSLDQAALVDGLRTLRIKGIDSLAVCLLNSHVNPVHEHAIADLVCSLNLGFKHISLSSSVAPLQKIVPRGDTTVVDAYLTPVIADYLSKIAALLTKSQIKVMTSAGGLVNYSSFRGKDSILSGPAGGVVGVQRVAEESQSTKAVGFDMGGTSTDICHIHGECERRYEMEVKDPNQITSVRIVAPMLAIETVAAGGGSIVGFDGLRLTVGPASAGASPGPACYGAGGPATITDCNLLLGRLQSERFPFALDLNAAEARMLELCHQINQARLHDQEPMTPMALAAGYLAVAASNMARPIKEITFSRGHDVRDYTLISFGGAGAQHACQIADELGMKRIVQHPMASVLSAYGIGCADVRLSLARDVGKIWNERTQSDLEHVFSELTTELLDRLKGEAVSEQQDITWQRWLDLRYVGQDSILTMSVTAADASIEFAKEHQKRFGFVLPHRAVEVRCARLDLVAANAKTDLNVESEHNYQPESSSSASVWFHGALVDVPVFLRANLRAGAEFTGPALIVEPMTVVVVESGWRAILRGAGYIELLRLDTHVGQVMPAGRTVVRDPLNLALFHNRCAGIAENMGQVLQRTALSVNVKERLDFSCAIFAPDGGLVVNAPHIPVHLGAMSDSVRGVVSLMGGALKPGCAYITNDPYMGGSHLPDVTVITPVFASDGTLMFFTGSRAHHAEIGGMTPGSMPPQAKNLAEEGVLLRCVCLDLGDPESERHLRSKLASGPYPSRSIDDNIADIYAQVAANEAGRQGLLELIDQIGLTLVQAYMGFVRDGAAEAVRRMLRRFPAGIYKFADSMDDGTPIKVAMMIVHGISDDPADPEFAKMICDFTGSGPVHAGNLNANASIVKSAAFYVVRCLLGYDVPLNEGIIAPLSFQIPTPSILSPSSGDDPEQLAAVTAGNVETSQRLVDVMLGALGVAAASQGTMNNFLFGRSSTTTMSGFGYYETICGGSGAAHDADGASAVHTHMTNTRITDPEVLEERFPVRVKRFSIRRGSGGMGRHRGGDGVIRELEFLESLSVSLITSRRLSKPYGLKGGKPGEAGINRLTRRLGAAIAQPTILDPISQFDVAAGDFLTIETPGGGGYGNNQ